MGIHYRELGRSFPPEACAKANCDYLEIQRATFRATLGAKRGSIISQIALMCKTAFSIIVERAAKFVDSKGGKLEVYFEQSGKKEDRNIVSYMKELKTKGSPFSKDNSEKYDGLSCDDFRRIILGDSRRKTKECPLIQFADIVLYPVLRAGYEPDYRPYKALYDNKRVIDALLKEDELGTLGVKYSCFDFG